MEKEIMRLYVRAYTPLSPSYQPKLDTTPEMSPSYSSYFQLLTGILRWNMDLVRIYIDFQVPMMSSHLSISREGHLQHVYYIFGYLRKHHNSRLVVYPTYPVTDEDGFEIQEWMHFMVMRLRKCLLMYLSPWVRDSDEVIL